MLFELANDLFCVLEISTSFQVYRISVSFVFLIFLILICLASHVLSDDPSCSPYYSYMIVNIVTILLSPPSQYPQYYYPFASPSSPFSSSSDDPSSSH